MSTSKIMASHGERALIRLKAPFKRNEEEDEAFSHQSNAEDKALAI